jgi:hypothetical protein
MTQLRGWVCGLTLGFASSFVSCGTPASSCNAASCATGCCSSDNQCLPGSATMACGSGGKACAACQVTQTCNLGACQGSATGGGSAAGGGVAGGAAAGGRAGGTATGGGTAGGAATGGGTAGGSTGGGSTAGGSAGQANVVINELYGAGNNVGNDFVELFNAGTIAKDLSGFSVTDTEATDGGPKPREGVIFPAGTSLAAGGFLLVVADRRDAGVSTDCLSGPMPCFEARFGISQGNGETIFLLDAQGQIATSQYYPPDGGPGPRSFGRLPDGTGSFRATTSTPGAANQP